MRALTVRQPWASWIVSGVKDVENRTRNIVGSYRGPVVVHVSQAWAADYPDGLREIPPAEHARLDAVRGRCIGVVNVTGAHQHDADRGCWYPSDVLGWIPVDGSDPADADWRPHLCSPWAEPGVWHLELSNPRELRASIPATGKLGLWRVPPELAAHVSAALAVTCGATIPTYGSHAAECDGPAGHVGPHADTVDGVPWIWHD